jgi:hypothetical protein
VLRFDLDDKMKTQQAPADKINSPNNPTSGALLIVGRRDSGTFSMFFHVLGLLRQAEALDLVPIVYFNRLVCYWSESGFEGKRNAWDYFFLPVSPLSLEQLGFDLHQLENLDVGALRSVVGNSAVVSDDYLAEDIGYGGKVDHRQRMICADLVDRYVRIQPQLSARIEEFHHQHLAGRFVIGVHYRGTDKIVEAAPAPYESYQRSLDLQITFIPSARIFVATDCKLFLDWLEHRYGDRVMCIKAIRSHDGKPVHFGCPQSGAEAVVDVVLLSRTHHFIHGESNVSAAVLVFNRDLPHTDLTAT